MSQEGGAIETGAATTPWVERGVAALLGADAAHAEAAVGLLVAAGRLGDGLALPALLLASRRGTDAAGAIVELAEGRPLPDAWSDYERRTAEEEGREDVRAVLGAPSGSGPQVRCVGPDAPLTAALAVRAAEGSGLVVAPPGAAGGVTASTLVAVAWIARLARAARWPLLGEDGARVATDPVAALPLPAHDDAVGLVVAVTAAHLRLLP